MSDKSERELTAAEIEAFADRLAAEYRDALVYHEKMRAGHCMFFSFPDETERVIYEAIVADLATPEIQ